jgi:hypothetical protein
MATKTASQPRTKRAARSRAVCSHHWVIDPPSGPISTGHCKMCGRQRKFPNSSEDSIWDGAEGRSRWNDMGISRRRRPGEERAQENVVAV